MANFTKITGRILDVGRKLTVQKAGAAALFVIPLRHASVGGYTPVLAIPGKIFKGWNVSSTDDTKIFKLAIVEQLESWGALFNNATACVFEGKIFKMKPTKKPIGANVRLWEFSLEVTGQDYTP